MKVVGMKVVTGDNPEEITKLWNKFIARMPELESVAVPDCSLGICRTLKNGKIEYLAARVVKDDSLVPDGMVFRELPEQLVAVFTHTGSLEDLVNTYDYIYNKWLFENEYEIIEAAEMEWYDKRFKYDDPNSQMDIHIPLKPLEIDENIDLIEEIFVKEQEEI